VIEMSAPQPPRVSDPGEVRDEPLPLTLRFVFVLGGLILAGWFAMFLLLQERW
jgi:hypothetical protein